jgi:conserved domain protein
VVSNSKIKTQKSKHKTQNNIVVIVTLQRDKCIGCNYCVEMAPEQFQMSKKDGKSVLLRSTEKKGFFTLKSHDDSIFEACENAQKACPVKIITTKKI